MDIPGILIGSFMLVCFLSELILNPGSAGSLAMILFSAWYIMKSYEDE